MKGWTITLIIVMVALFVVMVICLILWKRGVFQHKLTDQTKLVSLLNSLRKNSKNGHIYTSQINIPILYINLDRSPIRRKCFTHQADLLGLQYTRISAIDGLKVDPLVPNVIDGVTLTNDLPRSLSVSELACTMSHLKAIDYAHKNRYEVALIFEDDVSFDFMPIWPKDAIAKLITTIPDHIGIIQLSWNQDGRPQCVYKTVVEPTLLPLNKPCASLVAYIITKRGMTDILGSIEISQSHIHLKKKYDLHRTPQADVYLYQLTSVCTSGIPLFMPNNIGTHMKSTMKGRSKYDWHNREHIKSIETVASLYVNALSNTPTLEFRYPKDIDVVYTWMDSKHPGWKAIRKTYEPPSTVNPDRVADRMTKSDLELELSLELTLRNMPYVRKIFIVAPNGHIPESLITNSVLNEQYKTRRIVMINQDDILTKDTIHPTFNGVAVETCIHRIPGLAEQFVYFNDDFYVQRFMNPRHLFQHGKPVVYGNYRLFLMDRPIHCSSKEAFYCMRSRTINLLRRQNHKVFMVAHQFRSMSKTACQASELRYAKQYRAIRSHRFRSKNDFLLFELVNNHGLDNGLVILGDNHNFPSAYHSNSNSVRKLNPNTVALCINNCNSLACEKTLNHVRKQLGLLPY